MAEEIIWLMLRTVLALRPLGWFLDSIRSTLPVLSSFLYSYCKSREDNLLSGIFPMLGLMWLSI